MIQPGPGVRRAIRLAATGLALLGAGLGLAAAHSGPATAQASGETIAGQGVVLRGDELMVNGTPVRLDGVAAPAQGQMCKNRYGREYDCDGIATGVLTALVGNEPVSCRVVAQTSLGGRIGHCTVRGVDLGGAMVSRGWAFAYRSLTHDYSSAEAAAQSRQRGMWAGRVEKPWQWRSRMNADQAR